MSTPWAVTCAGCGCHLAYSFDSAPHQLYCGECAFKSDAEDEEEEEGDESED